MIKKNKCQQFSKIPQMAEKKLACKLSKATHIEEKQHSGAHPLAVYPPVAILLLIITPITEQYNYLEY